MNKKKKKILHIVEAFGGGVFWFFVDLINGTKENFEIVVAYGEREEKPKDFEKYFGDKVKFIKVEEFTRKINCKRDIKSYQAIKRIVKEEQPDIVHLHSSKAGVLGRLAINGKEHKIFYNPHGFYFLKGNSSIFKKTIYWLVEKVIAKINKKCTIVGCSEGEYIEAKKLNKNSVCITNGINIHEFKKITEDLKERKTNYENLKICTIGRIRHQKNPKMFNEIAKKFPELQFTWIGDGEQKNKLTSPNIKITGWKSREDVMKILNENDILILTSLWEGLSIALLEAMYLKKICVVSDVIGNRDVIENEKNGFIVKSVEETKEVIEKIVQNKDKNIDIKNKANKDIIDEYNSNIMIEKYKKLYAK